MEYMQNNKPFWQLGYTKAAIFRFILTDGDLLALSGIDKHPIDMWCSVCIWNVQFLHILWAIRADKIKFRP